MTAEAMIGAGANLLSEVQDADTTAADMVQEIELFEKKEMELHRAQVGLIMRQMATVIRDLNKLQQEIKALGSSHNSAIDEHQCRVDHLEKMLGAVHMDLTTAAEAQAKEFQERSNHLACVLDESTSMHAKTLESIHKRLDQLESHPTLCEELQGKQAPVGGSQPDSHAEFTRNIEELTQQYGSLQRRVDYCEHAIGEHQLCNGPDCCQSLQFQPEKIQDIIIAHRHELEERLDHVNTTVTGLVEKHAEGWAVTHARIDQLQGGRPPGLASEQQMTAAEADCASLKERIDYLEAMLSDSANKHEQHSKELQVSNAFFRDSMGHLEKALHEAIGRHAEQMQAHEVEVQKREARQASLSSRLGSLEVANSSIDTIHDHLAAIGKTVDLIQNKPKSQTSSPTKISRKLIVDNHTPVFSDMFSSEFTLCEHPEIERPAVPEEVVLNAEHATALPQGNTLDSHTVEAPHDVLCRSGTVVVPPAQTVPVPHPEKWEVVPGRSTPAHCRRRSPPPVSITPLMPLPLQPSLVTPPVQTEPPPVFKYMSPLRAGCYSMPATKPILPQAIPTSMGPHPAPGRTPPHVAQ